MLKLRFSARAQILTGGSKEWNNPQAREMLLDVRILIHDHKFVESHAP
jgi:hypothetical protein